MLRSGQGFLNQSEELHNMVIFFGVIDRETPTTGVWVLDWVIYNSIFNEISSIAREVDQGASSRL